MSTKRKVTAAVKKQVAGTQRFTCAANVEGYTCPLSGSPFDEAGYEIDHIIPLSDGGSNETSNLQALCLMCHRVKSNRASVGKEKKPKKPKTKTEKKPVEEKIYYWPDDASARPVCIRWKPGTDSLKFGIWRQMHGYDQFPDINGDYYRGR